jgi:hypothetical protein
VKIFKRRGWGFMCWECGLGMSGGNPVKLVWLLRFGHGLWSFCDCWTLCFGLSSFLLRKDWLTTTFGSGRSDLLNDKVNLAQDIMG